ncbi:MAG: DJ-1/PfpI family protein [Acidobacteria bacterium]|nr:DJ-1/PfpI family protein [Acidobacteriota bacterium]
MRLTPLLWICCSFAAIAVAGFGGWLLSLPARSSVVPAPEISREESEAALAALKPRKRVRPLIAIAGRNSATETNDYLIPYGILKRSGAADVVLLATEPGPVNLYPALKVESQATTAQFDAQHPGGADYVIVPAMSQDEDAAVLRWIRRQAELDATIIGVCAGAKILASAGLLDHKRATTHWYYIGKMTKTAKTASYVADRRFVVDGRIATTTGITASIPMMLTLVEAIAGRERAESTGRSLGVGQWSARHASSAFQQTRRFTLTVMGNVLGFWRKEQLGIHLTPGIDEVALGLVADAWSRTYRSHAVTFASKPGAVETRNGLRIIPDRVDPGMPQERILPALNDRLPAAALEDALRDIEARYGRDTAEAVAMQLEYAR